MTLYTKALVNLEHVYNGLECCNERLDCSNCYYLRLCARCMMNLHKDLLIIFRSSLFGCNKIKREGGKDNES